MGMGSRGRLTAEPNITPFIDVLLVLLMVWLVAIMMVGKLEIQLAQEQGSAGAAEGPIVLELPDSGGYVVNHRVIAPAALAGHLHSAFLGRRPSILFVKAGGRRTYRETIAAIDVAKGAGVQTVALVP